MPCIEAFTGSPHDVDRLPSALPRGPQIGEDRRGHRRRGEVAEPGQRFEGNVQSLPVAMRARFGCLDDEEIGEIPCGREAALPVSVRPAVRRVLTPILCSALAIALPHPIILTSGTLRRADDQSYFRASNTNIPSSAVGAEPV